MSLLEFALGPALQWSIAILLFGIGWRLIGALLLNRPRDLSAPRSRATLRGALRLMVMRSWPHREFLPRTWLSEALGYSFHIGFFIALLLALPHIKFVESIAGVSWPALPERVIHFVTLLSCVALLGVLIRRLTHPVLRMLSNFDDYASWVLTIAPLLTGLLIRSHIPVAYETLLAVHILSVELLMIWFPFSKLMHAFFIWTCRGTTGAAFTRKGALDQ